jgi:ABC-type spermidine/putrescine transport system permease subunit I
MSLSASIKARPARVTMRDGRWLLLGLPATLMLLGAVVPLGSVVWMAFSDGPAHAWAAVTDELFLLAVQRTFVMAAVVTTACIVLGIIFALALVVSGPITHACILGTLLISFSVSIVVRTYGWIVALQPQGAIYWGLHELGMLDRPVDLLQTNIAMYAGMVHVMLPYSVLLMMTAIKNVDSDSLRSAQSMGATPVRILTQVVLPQTRTAAITASMLIFIMSLGFLITPLFLGPPNALTISTVINLQISRVYDFAAAATMGLTLLIVVIGSYLVAERLFGISRTWAES